MTIRRWTVAPVSAGLVLVLLLGAIGAGLRVPGLSYLAGLPGFGALDYRTLSGSAFLPLRPGYVDGLLGTSLADQAASGAQQPSPLELDDLSAADGADAAAAALFGGSPTEAGTASPQKSIDHAFTNDDVNDPLVITSLPFAARTDNRKATREPGEPDSCAPRGGTAWYSYTARRASTLLTDTSGSDHPTAIGVFTPGPGSGLRQVGCATGPAGNAQLSFAARKGQRYLFQVAGLVTGGQLTFHLSALGRTALAYSESARPLPGQGSIRPAVSGDGRHVAYITAPGFGCPDRPVVSTNCPRQLYVVDRRTGQPTLVSRSTSGAPATGSSILPSLSRDGRYIGFSSTADDLVQDDTNGAWDYFVHDRLTGRTVRASVDSRGRQGTPEPEHTFERTPKEFEEPGQGWLSADGRFAAFESTHGDLVEGDPSRHDSLDLFVRDLRTGVTTREAIDVGHWSDARSADSRISRDGRYVAYLDASRADCGSSCMNVYLRDRTLGITRIVSVGSDGSAANSGGSFAASRSLSASADGQVLAWSTPAPLGDRADTDEKYDVFVVDMRDGRAPRRVSVPADGIPEDTSTRNFTFGDSVTVSGDGTRVAFHSNDPDLVPGDTNGVADTFLHDLTTGVTTRVSTSTAGVPGNGDTRFPSLSHDGRVVTFDSESDNFVAGDTALPDIFVHDLSGV